MNTPPLFYSIEGSSYKLATAREPMGSQFEVSANHLSNWITSTSSNFSTQEQGDESDNESLTLPLTELTAKISRISYTHFLNQLKVCVDELNKNTAMRNPKNVGILVNHLKSNGWVAALARDKMGFQGKYYTLGSARADDFLTYLHNVNVDNLPDCFVLFDDASFSGNQMHDHLVAINDGLSTLSGRHFSIHVAVPFITSVARRRLQSIPKKGNIDIHLSSHQIVPTVKELLTPRTYQILSNSLFLQYLHDENDNGVALSYFDHKIPNSQSFLFAGGGWGADFMPCIKPPYCKK